MVAHDVIIVTVSIQVHGKTFSNYMYSYDIRESLSKLQHSQYNYSCVYT